MSNLADLEFVTPGAEAEVAAVGFDSRRRFRLPLWARLLLGNWKSRLGLIIFGVIVVAALAAPWLAKNPPDEIVALPGQPPNRHFLFGTTDQGYDVFSQVVWGARHEFAMTVEDVLARRTRSLFLDARASIESAPRVATVLAGELGQDDAWAAEQVRRFQELARGYLLDSRE